MRIRVSIVLFIIVLASQMAKSQVAGFNAIGYNMYPGFLVAHRDDVKNMEAHTLGFELSLCKKNIRETWASNYRDPQFSVGLMYMNLGKPQLTGNVFAILPTFSRLIGQRGNTDFRFKAGSGIGYLTKKFDPYTNRRNQSIGSNLNGAMQLYVLMEHHKPNSKYALDLGIGITHFSNGSFRVPNLGVNMPSLQMGISTVPQKEMIAKRDSLVFHKWKLFGAYAFKERRLTNPHGFHIFNMNVVRLTPRSNVKDWRIGGDIFIDKTHHFLDFPDESLRGLNPLEVTEIGVFGGHQWLISRFQFKVDIGFYAYKPSKNKFITYQRLGFDYNISDQFFATWNLKTHFGIADHFTFGLGYRL